MLCVVCEEEISIDKIFRHIKYVHPDLLQKDFVRLLPFMQVSSYQNYAAGYELNLSPFEISDVTQINDYLSSSKEPLGNTDPHFLVV
jgi:hypothetical protein